MRPQTQEALRKIAYVRSKPKKKVRFDNSRLDFRGVEDRRGWYDSEHETAIGKALSEYMNTTLGGMLWDGSSELLKRFRRR